MTSGDMRRVGHPLTIAPLFPHGELAQLDYALGENLKTNQTRLQKRCIKAWENLKKEKKRD